MSSARGPKAEDQRLGRTVRSRRLALGLSLQTVAGACGTTFQQIQKYESGRNRISASRLLALCKLLQTTPNALLGVDEAPQSSAGEYTHALEILATPEGKELMALFASIPERSVRRQVVELVRTLQRVRPPRALRSSPHRRKKA